MTKQGIRSEQPISGRLGTKCAGESLQSRQEFEKALSRWTTRLHVLVDPARDRPGARINDSSHIGLIEPDTVD